MKTALVALAALLALLTPPATRAADPKEVVFGPLPKAIMPVG